MNKSLLILKSELKNLVAAEAFLRNREWKTFSTTSLKEALTYMIQHPAAFVMISVDHPSKKTAQFAKALSQAFPCCIIHFAEKSAAESYEKLTASKSEYLLYPQVTGPAIERTAHRFYKDQAAKNNGLPGPRHNSEEQRERNASIRATGGVPSQKLLSALLGEEGLKDVGYGHVDVKGSARLDKWQLLESPNRGLGNLTIEDHDTVTRNFKNSIVLKGLQQALDLSAIRKGPDEPVPLEQRVTQASSVACIVVESSRFSGYLVAAMGRNRAIDADFIRRVRDRLFSFLTANGEVVVEEENLNINIKEVPFEDWALECAEFLRKSVHKGDEVAMAFFPHSKVKAKIEKSPHEEMVAISLDEISIDVAVDFNLYIYLPANKKYVLYTPRGGKMYGKQKENLVKQGILKVHMMKNNVQDFNKYRAQNFLNSKVAEYENIKKIESVAI